MELYLRDLGNSNPLSAQEEKALGEKIQAGDIKARNQLVEANLRFVISVAKGYSGRGVPMEDLVNSGNLGLIRAAERFDASLGCKFITYAVWWVINEINRQLSAKDIVITNTERSFIFLSLDKEFDDSHETFSSKIPSSGDAPDEMVIRQSVVDGVEKLLANLGEREAMVLKLFFGLIDEEEDSIDEEGNFAAIGRRLNLSRERPRQIFETALRKLRHPALRDDLEALLNGEISSDDLTPMEKTLRSLRLSRYKKPVA